MTTEQFFIASYQAIEKEINAAKVRETKARECGDTDESLRWCNRAIGMLDARLQMLEVWAQHEQEVIRGS